MQRRHALLVASALALAACKDKPKDAAPPAPSASASVGPASSAPTLGAADASVDRRRQALRGGRGGALFEAAYSLEGLKDDQRAKIDEAEKKDDVDPATRAAIRSGAKDLNADLVVGVKAGKIDMSRLEPRFAEMERSIKAQQGKEMEAIAALHAALTPAQRKTVTAEARAKDAAREERFAKHAVAAGDAGKPGRAGRSRLERMTRDLDLDAEQQKKVAALTPSDGPPRGDPAEAKKQRESLYAAFEADAFDPTKVESFDAKRLRGPIEEEAKIISSVLPILKPAQRDKLASKLESGRGGGSGRPIPAKDTEKKDDDDDK